MSSTNRLTKVGSFAAAASLTFAAIPASAALAQSVSQPVEVVEVEGGLVSGIPGDVEGVQVFRGIPYAGSTAGANRFLPPQPVEPWEGVKIADTWGDQALQDPEIFQPDSFWYQEFYFDSDYIPPVSENGLVLNIWTPAETVDANLPVYFWNHGGANDHGNASEMEFNASKLAAQGIVVVSAQYRLGAMSSLVTPEMVDNGGVNLAVRDLIDALQWVQAHIDGFGGNPNAVTIGGQSAGGGNVGALLRSPLAKGLFQRAVIESAGGPASAQNLTDVDTALSEMPGELEEVFGHPVSFADLQALSTEDLLARDDSGLTLYSRLNNAIGKSRVLDNEVFTAESLDTTRPGALDGIDIMVGTVSDERTPDTDPNGTLSEEDFIERLNDRYGDGWQDAYIWDDEHNGYILDQRSRADVGHASVQVSAEYAAAHNEGNVYAFYFNHTPPGHNAGFHGSYHSSDLWYFFNSMRADVEGQRPWTSADYRMGEIMSTYLANFVKTGDPNGGDLPEWSQAEDGKFMWFTNGMALTVSNTPYPDRDALNRAAALESADLTEEDLRN